MASDADPLDSIVRLSRYIQGDDGVDGDFLAGRRLHWYTRSLKDRTHSRVNQFAVQARLNGLTEKFGVLNRDDLADALQTRIRRVDAVENPEWIPDVLHLLLELSDRPAEKTNLESLDRLQSEEPSSVALTWAEILSKDPLNEASTWDDVDRGYHSSGDDANTDVDDGNESEITDDTLATSMIDEDLISLARHQLVEPDVNLLDDVKDFNRMLRHDCKADSPPVLVAELFIAREILNMLHGLPTDLFDLKQDPGVVTLRSTDYRLSTVSHRILRDLLQQCADVGTRISLLRQWTASAQNVIYLQTIQASCQQLLNSFDKDVAKLESTYIPGHNTEVVSLKEIFAQILRIGRPLVDVAGIILSAISEDRQQQPPHFSLDALHTAMCVSHIAGDRLLFDRLASMMSAALRTYLTPLQTWMQSGLLPQQNSHSFLVAEANAECQPGNIWHERWFIRTLANGQPFAPAFMYPFVDSIFSIGKTAAFLRLLSVSKDGNDAESTSNALNQFGDLSRLDNAALVPSSELLNKIITDWIHDNQLSLPSLPDRLINQCGLLDTIDALEYVYFAKGGAQFQLFTDSLFERKKLLPKKWLDPFYLTEIAQSTLGSNHKVDIPVNSVHISVSGNTLAGSCFDEIASMQLKYHFSWPVQNITCCETPGIHSMIFTFLLQTDRARHCLCPSVLDFRGCRWAASKPSASTWNALSLRQSLLFFVNVMNDYISTTAAKVHAQMRSDLVAAAGMEEMADVWVVYEQRLSTNLLLRSSLKPIKNAVLTVFKVCESFAFAWDTLFQSSGKENQDHHISHQWARMKREYESNISFIVAGLRGVSRAARESALVDLAESLEGHG